MYGWIIYNGALRINKMETLVQRLQKEAINLGVELDLLKNNEIIPYFDSEGKPEIEVLKENISAPEFIIFWDKDIYLAKHLETLGMRLFNTREAIEICDNKSLTHLQLSNLGFRLPKTIISPFVFSNQRLSDNYLNTVLEELGGTIVIKEVYGSFGMQIHKVTGKEELKTIIDSLGNKQFILQEYIPTSTGRDIRVNIVGDNILGAMERSNSKDFRANITLGGQGKLIKLNPKQEEVALKAHKALGLDFSGVDLLYGNNEEPLICEVNSNLNFLSFENLSGINIADAILSHIMGCIK